jgi:hypothetical protein
MIGTAACMSLRKNSERDTGLTAADAQRIVAEAARHYFDSRRLGVDAFVDRHFSLAGSAAIHRKALGWDMLKAPANLALAVPNLAVRLVPRARRRSVQGGSLPI